jgi:uncharacterized protein
MLSPSFLGRGFAYPLRLDATGTRPAFTQDEERVYESIRSILNTNVGERPHRVKNGIPYGTRFRSLLFTNVASAIEVAIFDAKNALTVWEPRIILLDVSAERAVDPLSKLKGIRIYIGWTYRATNRPDNHVDFYKSSQREEL